MASLKQLYEAQSSLVAYWPLVERTKNGVRKIWLDNVAPNGPESVAGEFIGTQVTAEGPFFAETVIDFDGSTNAVSITPYAPKYLFSGEGAITITARVYADSIPAGAAYHQILVMHSANGAGPSASSLGVIVLDFTDTDEVRLVARSLHSDTASVITSTTSPISTATWYQITAKIDFANDDMFLRVDSTQVATTTTATFTNTTYTHVDGDRNQYSFIGTGPTNYEADGIDSALCFDGRICHVAVFDSLLSDATCDLFANATSGYFNTPVTSVADAISVLNPDHWWKLNEASGTTATDSGSPGGKSGTYVGSPSLNVLSSGSPDGDGFVNFDGTDDYVDAIGAVTDWVNFHQNDKSGTIVAFYRLTDVSNDALMSFWGTAISSTTHGFLVSIDNRSSVVSHDGIPLLSFNMYKGVGISDARVIYHKMTLDTNWHMIVFRKNDQEGQLMIDNQIVAAGIPYAANDLGTSNSNFDLTLGSISANYYFKGQMAYVALWNGFVQDELLTSIYNAFISGTASLSLTLRNTNGQPKASLTGLYWWYYPDAPSAMADGGQTAAAWGSGASTNAQGVFSVTQITGPGVVPGNGYMIITDSDGTPGNTNVVAATPVTLT